MLNITPNINVYTNAHINIRTDVKCERKHKCKFPVTLFFLYLRSFDSISGIFNPSLKMETNNKNIL